MLIKVYTHAFPTVLHILENVTDIRIDHNIRQLGSIGDDVDGRSVYTFGDEFTREYTKGEPKPAGNCTIDFLRDGVRSRLLVANFAYVCNDEGKTIEKVSTQ